MALTPEEQKELDQLNMEAGISAPSGLTPEEAEELRQLNLEAGITDKAVAPTKKEIEKGDIEENELQQIADLRGVSVDFLKEKMPYMGGFTGGYTSDQSMLSQAPQRIAGEVGKQVFLGIPQKIYTLAQDEKEQAALDDLRSLISAKRTFAQNAAELGVGLLLPGGAIAKGAKTVLGRLGAAAATGATYGATASRTGEEVEGALVGGAAGAALGGAAMAVPKIPAAYNWIKGKLGGEVVDEASRFAKMQEVEKKAEAIIKDSSKEIEDKAKFFSTPEFIDRMIPEAKATRKQLRDIQRAVQKEKPTGEQGQATADLLKGLGARIEEQGRIVDEAREFAGHLQGRSKALPLNEAIDVLKQAGKTEAGFIQKEYANFRYIKAFEKVQADTLAARIPKEKNFISRFKELVYDGTVMARVIDRAVAGSDMTVTLDTMARNKRLFDTQIAAKLMRSTELKDALTKTGIDNDQAYKILDTVDILKEGGRDTIIKSGLSEDQADALIKYRQSFEDLRGEAEKLGLKIEARDAYVPHLRVSTPETIRRIMNEARKAKLDIDDPRNTPGVDDLLNEYSKYRQYLNTGFKAAAKKPEGLDDFVSQNESFVNTVRALEYIGGQNIDSAFNLGVALRQSQSPQLLNRLAITEARRAMQRTMDMPDFIREKNLAKLYLDWSTDTFKHIYFREGLGKLKVIRDLAVASNNRSAADYVERLRQDLTGLREGTGLEWTRRATQKFQLTMKILADKAPTNSYKKQLYETLGETPELFGIIASQVYPNFLGLSAKAIIANLTSPFTMAIPELGTAYGMRKLLAAGLQSANYMRAGRKIAISEELSNYLNSKKFGGRSDYRAGEEVVFSGLNAITMNAKNKGYMGPQYSSELFRAVEGGIKDGKLYNMGMGAIEKWNTVAMYAFEKSETAIRSMMSDVADSVAADLIAKNSGAADLIAKNNGAQKFMAGMDRAYQLKLQKALGAGDATQVTNLVKDYLVGRTLFNYDRISMNEFGRSMGPLFSVFSKWPTTIAADVIDRFEEKGAVKGGRKVFMKYMAPLAFLFMMDKMAEGLDVSPDKSDLAYRLIGREGFRGMAPINSINPLLEGTMVKPPVIDALAGGIMALSKADPEALWKWANKTTQAFLPGSGMLRFLVDDLPVWMGEDRLQGPFAEKIYKRVTGER